MPISAASSSNLPPNTNHIAYTQPHHNAVVPAADKSASNFSLHGLAHDDARSTHLHEDRWARKSLHKPRSISRHMSRNKNATNESDTHRLLVEDPSRDPVLGTNAAAVPTVFDPPNTAASDSLLYFDQGHGPYKVLTRDREDSDSPRTLQPSKKQSRDHFLTTEVVAGTALPRNDNIESDKAKKEKPVSWRSLPRKDQLLVLMLARLSEPLTQTSLGAYLYYQLESFDPTLPDSTISSQAGLVQAAFPFAQFLTAILWGRFADSEYGGRKRVIYIGLLGTMFSIIGFGFSSSFGMAITFRLFGGILNGNIGVMRTMISEIIKEKKYQSRAFIILPMTFNVGVIIGPILGKQCDSTCPLHRTHHDRWPASGSSEELSFCVRSRIVLWRERWCILDEDLAIRAAQYD